MSSFEKRVFFLAAMLLNLAFLFYQVFSCGVVRSILTTMPPEGPEVRRTADWLLSCVQDCVVRDVEQSGRFTKQPIARLGELKSKIVNRVRCRGKVIVLDFDEDISAISTLGMSGRWTRSQGKHIALTLWCEKPPARGILPVYYDDQRRFGNFRIASTREATSRLDELGWDALAEPMTSGKARQRAMKYAKKRICDVLLMQDVFAGVGNYIRSEALRRSCVAPTRTVASLSKQDWSQLCDEVRNVMSEAYAAGGARLRDYQVDDLTSVYQFHLRVYGRTHDPEGNSVVKFKCASGRTVWWCPAVQV